MAALRADGHEILPIGRSELALDDKELGAYLEGCEIIINMAGANIAHKWDREYKKVLYKSRIDTTHKIVRAITRMNKRPKKLISTSAVGIYDEEGTHTENDYGYAVDFLGLICRDWEREAKAAIDLDVDVVIFRFGVVIGKNGGALSQMLPAFRLGIGGTIGDGHQPFSWVHMDDLIAAYKKAINDHHFTGTYNLTAPNPTTNKELTRTLGKILHRPTLIPLPPFVLKLIFGEGADVLTVGQRVLPKRLLDRHFAFKFPDIESALRDVL
jgi:hypothetical protein